MPSYSAGVAMIRDAVASRIAAQFGVLQSPWISDGPFRDPSVSPNGMFSVTVPRTDAMEARRARGNGDGIVCRSTVRVRMLYTLRPDAADSDYTSVLDIGAALAGVVASTPVSDGAQIGQLALQWLTHEPVGDDTGMLITGEWSVVHQLFVYPSDYTPPE